MATSLGVIDFDSCPSLENTEHMSSRSDSERCGYGEALASSRFGVACCGGEGKTISPSWTEELLALLSPSQCDVACCGGEGRVGGVGGRGGGEGETISPSSIESEVLLVSVSKFSTGSIL